MLWDELCRLRREFSPQPPSRTSQMKSPSVILTIILINMTTILEKNRIEFCYWFFYSFCHLFLMRNH
ncbi:hypothetical protein CH54_3592 [Yersinia rochesterensis]|uniref:Uncharacterized protein n=1 Tax=Yersinia rochesterensis TaxID=1604335 RepID=A0ABN4FPE6_9GAMM|nr:hypothetical protein DJ57_410 [Yersinia rochesterensis]AJI86657.1 hypothetical protein AW19_2194 [Yersinia frederiksenii Y225]AJJ37147.1 hypothetical protein CH54_3592 [Yersinia rochesterensis]CNG91434.1 Uncharacterised protein [Yersinia kristensenii]CRY63593.1 Uncharacterised protein [Yersinia kristensenii]